MKKKLRKVFASGGDIGPGPGNPPIRVSSPKDPRIQRYQDSLSLYNYGKEGAKDLLSMKELDKESDFIKRDSDRYPDAAFSRLAKFNGSYPDAVGTVSKQLGYVKNVSRNDKNYPIGREDYLPVVVDQPQFKKPVQPYYYSPEPVTQPRVASAISRSPIPTNRSGITPPTVGHLPEAKQQVTPFSFSGMDRSDGQQKSVYFPDLKSWQEFTDKQGYLHTETTNNDREAHATGYFKYGGTMKKKMRPVFQKFLAGGSDTTMTGDPDPYGGLGIIQASNLKGGNNFNWMNTNATDAVGNTTTPTAAATSTNGWQKAFTAAGAIAPYASNIANSFRRPPMPPIPGLVNPVTLSNIDLSEARNRISRTTRGQDLNADKTLDPQSAAAVRNANLAKEIEGTSQVSEQEAFLNSRQRAEQAGMNLNVDTMNTSAMNHYKEAIMERNIASQREQSQNLANASDKFIGQENERAKADLDLKKIGVLSQMWKDSGVYDRMLKKLKDQGIDDPTGILAQRDLTTHAMGGKLRRVFPEHDMGGRYADGGQIPGSDPLMEMAFGGFTAGTGKLPMNRGRATGLTQINPFGGGQKGGIGLGNIPNGKFSSSHAIAKGRSLYQDGGGLGMDTPDDLMSNDNTRAMGGQLTGPFTEDYFNGPRPTPGPDTDAGMDLLKKGGWIGKAVNPAHKGYCTPMTKSTCTPRRKAFAMTMKKHHGFH